MLITGQPRPLAGIDLRTTTPLPPSLGSDAKPGTNVPDRGVLGFMLRHRLLEHPERTLPELRRILTGHTPSSNRKRNQTQGDSERTQQVAEEAGAIWLSAQDAADEQAQITTELQTQADAAAAEMETARAQVARLVAWQQRSGGLDFTATLLFSSQDPDELLTALGIASRLAETNAQLYDSAAQLTNTARSLQDQAAVAQTELDRRQEAALAAFEQAQTAALEAETILVEQQENEARLAAQLVVLTENRRATEADYNKGIQARWGAGAAGIVTASGWALPARGYISSRFGWRPPPLPGVSKFHSGLDLSGANYCGTPIYAAAAGRVTYAGPNGGLGNYIQIDHGNGYVTGYAHLQPGGIGVRIGETVAPGQNIGRAGTTGLSTGCHLHFILRENGNPIDPLAFLQNQGVVFG
jgi:murein DD-endopeptidase MepM/ murein hydrolase activator NlpD